MFVRSPSLQSGLTLIEVLMTALVVGLIAAMVLPETTDNPNGRVDAAAAEVATALRFARDESIRTGTPHGVTLQGSHLNVFRLDGTGTPVYDIHHPITKQRWEIDFDDSPHYRDTSISMANAWRGPCNLDGSVAFQPDGTPFCTDPTTTILDQGNLTLQVGPIISTVNADGFTGRVWIQ
jgi:type II secretion system protein H